MSASCAVMSSRIISSFTSLWRKTTTCKMCVVDSLIKNRSYCSMTVCNSFIHRIRLCEGFIVLPDFSHHQKRIRNVSKISPLYRTFACCDKLYGKHNVYDKTGPKNIKQSSIQDVLKEKKDRLKERKDRLKESSQTLLKDIRETKNKMKERMEEVIERENIITIPNFLCVTRIILSPYLGYVIIQSNFNLAFGLFVFAGVTDLIDGWVARTYPSQATKIGSFLDPLADKILVAILFITLTYQELIPLALTGLIIARDVLLLTAGFYIRYKSLPPPKTLSRYFDATRVTAQLAPTFISKVNTAVQLLLVATTLVAPVCNCVDPSVIHSMWYITAGTTVASALSYILSRNTYKFLKPKK